MPQTTPERRSRWSDSKAISYLECQGYTLEKDWTFTPPKREPREMTAMEEDALIYLIEEWDFGGLNYVPGK